MADLRDRKPNSFTPVVAAMELADYVINITDNQKNFPECQSEFKTTDGQPVFILTSRSDSLVNRVREQAYQIFMLVFTANEINLNRQPYRKEERFLKQKQALALCEEHLATIQLCRKHFHLSNKRVKYWGEMVLKVRNFTEKWSDSDRLRYKDL